MKRIGLTLCVLCFCFVLVGHTNQTVARKTITGVYTIKTVQGAETVGVVVWGMNLSTDGTTFISCRGECELKIKTMLLKAGEVDFHNETGEAEARENVRITMLPERGRTRVP
jgi:hypothetical protein